MLERAFAADGASVSSSDGTYFEFRRPFLRGLVPSLVRSGAIRTGSSGDSIEVNAEATVRPAPGLLAVLAFALFPAALGAPPINSALSLLVSGGVIQFLYFKAVVGFWNYVRTLCKQISTAGHGAGSTRNARG